MTKKMIDADALLDWIKEIREDEAKTIQVTEMIFQGYSRTVPYISSSALKNKVEELSENEDPDPWCYDMSKAPKEKNVFLIVKQWNFPVVGYYLHEMERWHCKCDAHSVKPIAWMSIPEPKGATND